MQKNLQKNELEELRKKFEKEYSENHNLINKLEIKLDKYLILSIKIYGFMTKKKDILIHQNLQTLLLREDYLDIFKYEKQIRSKIQLLVCY